MLTHEQMTDLARPDLTVSDRIRALAAAGVSRADIARFLGKRYQHVRNVLEADKQRDAAPPPRFAATGVQEQGAQFTRALNEADFVESRGAGAYRLVVRPDGSILLPREVRAAFGVEDGGVVMAKLEGDAFGVISAETAMRRVRDIVRQFVPPGVDLVAELIADRKAEAAREAEGGEA
jgi:hypothetical protein